MQAKVDAQIDAAAGAGAAAAQSTSADLHHQPTPESIAAAEARLGEGRASELALGKLAIARKADAKGDKANCVEALSEARRALGP